MYAIYIYIYIYIWYSPLKNFQKCSYSKLVWVGFKSTTTPFRRSKRLRYQAMSSTRWQSRLFTATPISSLYSVSTFQFGVTGNHVTSGQQRIYAIMKTMCSAGYHQNGFVATHALGHMMYSYTLLIPLNQRVLNKLRKEHNITQGA